MLKQIVLKEVINYKLSFLFIDRNDELRIIRIKSSLLEASFRYISSVDRFWPFQCGDLINTYLAWVPMW